MPDRPDWGDPDPTPPPSPSGWGEPPPPATHSPFPTGHQDDWGSPTTATQARVKQPGWLSRNRRPVLVVVLVLLLVLILTKCLGDGALKKVTPGPREPEPVPGDVVEVVASPEACWTLTAMDQAQADVAARELKLVPETEETPIPSASPSAEPPLFTGCGPSTVTLPEDSAYAGLGFSVADDDDHHPLLWAAVLWLTRDREIRSGFFTSPDWRSATAFTRFPGQTYREHEVKGSERSTDFFAPTPDMTTSSSLVAKLPGGGNEVATAAAKLESLNAPEHTDLQPLYDAAVRAGARKSFLERFADIYAPGEYSSVASLDGEDGVRAFHAAATRLGAMGAPEKTLITAVRKLAYDRQKARITQEADENGEYFQSHAYDDALKKLAVLRAIDPSRKPDTDRLESTFQAEKVEADARDQVTLRNCDGDGDGICFE